MDQAKILDNPPKEIDNVGSGVNKNKRDLRDGHFRAMELLVKWRGQLEHYMPDSGTLSAAEILITWFEGGDMRRAGISTDPDAVRDYLTQHRSAIATLRDATVWVANDLLHKEKCTFVADDGKEKEYIRTVIHWDEIENMLDAWHAATEDGQRVTSKGVVRYSIPDQTIAVEIEDSHARADSPSDWFGGRR